MRCPIAYCGLDCEKCETYIATKNDDDDLRKKVADKWSKLNNVEIRPEMINCVGCKEDGVRTYYCDHICEIRGCAMEKGLSTCRGCSELGECRKIRQITDHSDEAKRNIMD